jgi:16S rRNA (guanine527-N7)-methyltransferase
VSSVSREILAPPFHVKTNAELVPLAERYGLTDAAVAQLAALLYALARDPHAPTTVREPEQAVNVHLADSLVALELTDVRAATSLADLGAGAGFPGLPLAVALPCARVALVESVARKCAFIRTAADAAGLTNVDVVAERAEAWAAGIGTRDLVTARALAPLAVLAEYAAPLLREGGVLLAWKGRRDAQEERNAAAAADELGLVVEEVRPVHPYAGAEHRHLHVLRKVAPTPERFPRRPGIARKRPLHAGTPLGKTAAGDDRPAAPDRRSAACQGRQPWLRDRPAPGIPGTAPPSRALSGARPRTAAPLTVFAATVGAMPADPCSRP